METMIEVKEILSKILTTECIFKNKNRSAWVCCFGNGMVVHIEDHRNDVMIRTQHHYWEGSILEYKLLDDIVDVEYCEDQVALETILVYECDQSEYPNKALLDLAKEKLWFGYEIKDCEITDEDMDNAISTHF